MKKWWILPAVVFMLISGCSTSQNQEITVFTNANGYTLQGDSLVKFSTLVVKDGKVDAVGDEGITNNYDYYHSIDIEGKTLLPGLIDAHGHVMGLGFQELNINIAGIETLEATLDSIKAYAEANPELEWIQGRGWNQTLWPENEFPTAQDLDKVVSDRPVWLSRVDGHAGWANTKAMEMAGIDEDTPDPKGGKIIRDENGKATGIFIDAAESYISSVVPDPTEKENERALEEALKQMSSVGLTSVHDAGIGTDTWELYTAFADQGKLTTRIYAMIGGAGEAFDSLSQNGPIESYANDLLSLRSVKLYSDGALGSRGAALIEPYSDDPDNRGLLFYEQEEMNRMVSKVVSEGYQANIHAIGDRGNRVVLNALENAINEFDARGLRHRIEHAQIVALKDIPRFAAMDLIASMQPTHATSDMNMAEDRVGPERIKGGYAWQRFLDQGTVVAAGSDFPVEHSNPFYGLYSAVTRQDHQGNPPSGWYAEQAMSRLEAFRAFTLDAAYAAHQEDVLGSLEKGKWADFIIIDQDYFNTEESNIWEINVLETWLAGKKIYSE